ERLGLDPPDDVLQQEAAIRDTAPLGAGKNPEALQILRFDLDFAPLRVGREFAPHVSAPPKEQSPAQRVAHLVGKVGVEHDVLKLLAVLMELLLVELVLQELGDDFRFSNAP